MVTKAPSNNLSAIKVFLSTSRIITLEHALLASMQRNCWYLSEHLVLFALADDDIELELKSKILDKLLDSKVPDLSKKGKSDLPVVLMLTELFNLVDPQSWLLLKVADVPKGEV
jgi:hypothetical protein